MALIQFNADLTAAVKALESIAHSLRWLLRLKVQPGVQGVLARAGIPDSMELPAVPSKFRTNEPRLSQPSDEDLWAMEEVERMRQEQGLPLEQSQTE